LLPDRELAALIERSQGDGAVVSFTGLARPRSSEGGILDTLILEHHPILTLRSLEQIARDAAMRFDAGNIHVVHRCGAVPVGEPIVFAGASSAHRRAAFEAADYLMDKLKTEAVFWKREVGRSGSQWIEPTASDYADRKRWG
jgi:molybdopterin synthase catalytic subunit